MNGMNGKFDRDDRYIEIPELTDDFLEKRQNLTFCIAEGFLLINKIYLG